MLVSNVFWTLSKILFLCWHEFRKHLSLKSITPTTHPSSFSTPNDYASLSTFAHVHHTNTFTSSHRTFHHHHLGGGIKRIYNDNDRHHHYVSFKNKKKIERKNACVCVCLCKCLGWKICSFFFATPIRLLMEWRFTRLRASISGSNIGSVECILDISSATREKGVDKHSDRLILGAEKWFELSTGNPYTVRQK